MLNAVLNKDNRDIIEMHLWEILYTKESGRPAQGIKVTKGTDTIIFIKYNKILLDRSINITYGITVVAY